MKKLDISQKQKRHIDSIYERMEKIKRVAFKKLGHPIRDSQIAKIAMDSYIKEAKEIEKIAKKYRSQVKQDSAYNDASKLYNLAEAISKTYAI